MLKKEKYRVHANESHPQDELAYFHFSQSRTYDTGWQVLLLAFKFCSYLFHTSKGVSCPSI